MTPKKEAKGLCERFARCYGISSHPASASISEAAAIICATEIIDELYDMMPTTDSHWKRFFQMKIDHWRLTKKVIEDL